ncbi:MAG: hypothetical protein EON54_24740, partial [Alcaligenaceae bacterium]
MHYSTLVRTFIRLSIVVRGLQSHIALGLSTLVLWLGATGAAHAQAADAVTEAPADTTLVQGGLLSQIFTRIGLWFDGLLDQIQQAGSALVQVRGLGQWWTDISNTPGAREAILIGTAWVVGIVA